MRSIPERLTIITINPAESAVGQSTDLAFYLVLFAVSTVVAVPLEELFFRGIVRPHPEERFHAAVAIAVASLLFVVVHTSVTVGSGGEAIAFGMFERWMSPHIHPDVTLLHVRTRYPRVSTPTVPSYVEMTEANRVRVYK